MIILILGKSHCAKSFYDLFSQNKENIVFSTHSQCKNHIDASANSDILDFIEANGVNFVLITDNSYMATDIEEEISNLNVSVFCPDKTACEICTSKSKAKKFMYKNKIATPKFLIIEKTQQGLDYIRNMTTAMAIKPDIRTQSENTAFFETYGEGEKIISGFFKNGNKKLLIEDYIEGKSFSIWVLTNGYDAKIIFSSAKYQDEIAYFNPDFLNEDIMKKIETEFVKPTISALNSQEEEYTGILGFDFILTFNNQLFLINYNGFFDEINVDFATKGFDIDWLDVFERTIRGDVFSKYNFKEHENFMLTLRQGENTEFQSAKTKSSLNLYLKELGYNTDLLKEAQKVWKY